MSEIPYCQNCDATGWVCENHDGRPWDGESNREDACGCGAGMPCPACIPPGEWPGVLYPVDSASIICAVPGFHEAMEDRRREFLKSRN